MGEANVAEESCAQASRACKARNNLLYESRIYFKQIKGDCEKTNTGFHIDEKCFKKAIKLFLDC